MKIPTKDMELWLLGWSESHSGGCKVTFQVSEDDLAYFKNATIRKGKTAGQRYAAVLVQLNDDETPDPLSVETVKPAPAAPPPPAEAKAPAAPASYPGGFTGLAVRWVQDEEFRDWLLDNFSDKYEQAMKTCNPKLKSFAVDVAATVVRGICGVQSRNELNSNHNAGVMFDSFIRGPYMAHLEELKVDA